MGTRLDLKSLPPPRKFAVVREVPAELNVILASNGDPLMLFGMSQGLVMCWPTKYILSHRFEFARYCKANAWRFRSARIIVNHPLNRRTKRWCKWLGFTVEQGIPEPPPCPRQSP